MKLYRKQLNSLEELRYEKRMLKRAVKNSEKEGFFSTGASDKKTEPEADDMPGILSVVGDLLGSSSIGGMALSVGLPILKQVAGKKILKSSGGILKTVVKEVGFSYVKWKAVELGIKGVRHLIKKNKEQKLHKKARTTY